MWSRLKSLLKSIPLFIVPLLVGQTGSVDSAQQIASVLSQIMMPLVTILLLVLVPILIFKAIAKGVLEKI